MLSFTFHDCIFKYEERERERVKKKPRNHRDTRNLVEAKKNKNVYARWIKDFFLMVLSDIWKLYVFTLGAWFDGGQGALTEGVLRVRDTLSVSSLHAHGLQIMNLIHNS
jgi:hypothetical protein